MNLKLKVGMKINISKKNAKEYQYASKIMEVKGNELLVLGPIKQGRYIYFPKGSYIYISFISELYGSISFECMVKELIRDNGFLLKVEKKSGMVANQSRDNFRVESSIKVELTQIQNDCIQKEETETIDISAGGMRVFSNFELKEGEELDALIELRPEAVHAKAKVIRRLESKSVRYKNQYALSFIDLEEIKEDAIVKYLFDYQRMLSSEGRYD